jgi:hypothetical protein
MVRLRLALAAVLISFSAVQYAQADGITNGRFETADFAGWTLGGSPTFPNSILVYHTITGTGFGLGPIQGASSALIVSRSGFFGSCTSPFDDWSIGCPLPPGVVGLPIAPLGGRALAYPDGDLQFGNYTSWIGQDIQGLAGDEIDLSVQYMTNDAFPTGSPFDFDEFEVIATRCDLTPDFSCPSDPNVYVYSNFALAGFANCPRVAPNSGSTGFRLATAPCDVRLTLPADALWTLYVGVTQGGDNIGATGILVDNVRQLREVVPVPSPGTLPLLLLGIGLAGLARSRHSAAG